MSNETTGLTHLAAAILTKEPGLAALTDMIGLDISESDFAELLALGAHIHAQFPGLKELVSQPENTALLKRVGNAFKGAIDNAEAIVESVDNTEETQDYAVAVDDFGRYSLIIPFPGNHPEQKDIDGAIRYTSPRGCRQIPGLALVLKEGAIWSNNAERILSPTDVLLCHEINDLVGNVANQGWAAADHQIGFILEEAKETAELGVKARNTHELRDGLCDIQFTALGMTHRAGVPTGYDFSAVNYSMLTKFDTTLDDAARTREKYEALGIETYVTECVPSDAIREAYRNLFGFGDDETEHLYITKVKTSATGKDGKFYAGHKFVKSYRFREPQFYGLKDTHPLESVVENDAV